MTLPSNPVDVTRNTIQCDVVALSYDTMVNVPLASKPTISAGTGAPTFSAPQGSMYIQINGGVNTRVYINTNGTTGWTPLSNAA